MQLQMLPAANVRRNTIEMCMQTWPKQLEISSIMSPHSIVCLDLNNRQSSCTAVQPDGCGQEKSQSRPVGRGCTISP
ncbi:hypothetical protein RRG08_050574 [Elysia crispata]|uniref:Uncharacterized protein n=1 Tax=Elysia crispata TaxID=231223 RepID=A0AAE0Z7U9_9GAST|nr:hypothetical protein RRG08_050574 [Elysia crispata]